MSKRKYVFPEMLKILLEEREMTQRGLAFKIRSSPYTVWAWLNKGTVPSAIMLTEVAEVFNVSLDYIVYGEEYGQKLLINGDNLIDLLECIQDANKGMTQEVEKTIDEVITIIYDLAAGNSNTQ